MKKYRAIDYYYAYRFCEDIVDGETHISKAKGSVAELIEKYSKEVIADCKLMYISYTDEYVLSKVAGMLVDIGDVLSKQEEAEEEAELLAELRR